MPRREIELVGLYPAAMAPCSACHVDELRRTLAAEEAREAPAASIADADLAARIADAILSAHGPSVLVRLTPIDSPRGLWLALRHRLGNRLSVLVDGRPVDAEPTAVVRALGA